MMWNGSGSAGPGGSMAEFIQSLMTQRPDLAQILAQMTRQQSSGLGQLAGQAPAGRTGDLAYVVGRDGPMPGRGGGYTPPPTYSGPMPQGGLWGMQGQQPTYPLPYAQRFNSTPDAPAVARMPTSYDGGRTYVMESGTGGFQGTGPTLPYAQRFNTNPGPNYPAIPMPTGNSGSKFYPPSGPKQYGPTQPAYTMPTGPKQYGTPDPYTAPTGPKYMPPTGPKSYGAPDPYVAPTGPKSYGFNEAPPAFTAPSQPKVYSPQPVSGDGTVGLDWYAQQAGA